MVARLPKIAILVTFALVSCGNKSAKVDPQFRTYVAGFESTVGADASDVDLAFKKLPPPTIGECNETDERAWINIDPIFWKSADTNQREELIFHELGHCVLGREHNNSLFSSGCPKSIMNEYEMTSECYESNRQALYLELRVGRP